MIALVWGCGGRKEEREKAKRCFQCPLHPPHLLLHLHPPLLSPSSRIGLLGRGGCVIVFPANVCKSASAGCKGNVCTVWLMYCNMRDDSSVAVRVPRKKKKKKKKKSPIPRRRRWRRRRRNQIWWLSGCLVSVRSVIPAPGRWTSSLLLSAPLCSSSRMRGDPEMMRGELLLLLLRLHVASSLQAALLLTHPVEPCMIDVYTFIYLFIYLFIYFIKCDWVSRAAQIWTVTYSVMSKKKKKSDVVINDDDNKNKRWASSQRSARGTWTLT